MAVVYCCSLTASAYPEGTAETHESGLQILSDPCAPLPIAEAWARDPEHRDLCPPFLAHLASGGTPFPEAELRARHERFLLELLGWVVDAWTRFPPGFPGCVFLFQSRTSLPFLALAIRQQDQKRVLPGVKARQQKKQGKILASFSFV